MTPLDKLQNLTDRMLEIDTEFMWRDEVTDKLCFSNLDERKWQAKKNREFIEGVESLIAQRRWEEATEELNDILPTLMSETEQYL